eukprot:gene33629-15528_t
MIVSTPCPNGTSGSACTEAAVAAVRGMVGSFGILLPVAAAHDRLSDALRGNGTAATAMRAALDSIASTGCPR